MVYIEHKGFHAITCSVRTVSQCFRGIIACVAEAEFRKERKKRRKERGGKKEEERKRRD
jgi:hypothetical protein